MKIYISYFQQIRYFKPNQIPVSTSIKWPFWIYENTGYKTGSFFLDKNNVINGIIEESLCFPTELYEKLEHQCSRNCELSFSKKACPFMERFKEYLDSVDFNYVMAEFERICNDVKKINNYEGDPEIILIVYEHPRIPCAERPVIVKWFKEHSVEVKEWVRNDAKLFDSQGDIF